MAKSQKPTKRPPKKRKQKQPPRKPLKKLPRKKQQRRRKADPNAIKPPLKPSAQVRASVLWFGMGHMLMAARFLALFGRSLDDFWINNVRGLDVVKFNKEIAGAGNWPLLKAVRKRWGNEGVLIIRRLLPKNYRHG